MADVSVHDAKTHLSRLIRRVAAGEEITILRSGTPVARLVPVKQRLRRTLGLDRDSVKVSEDFDAALPEEVLQDFEK